MAELGISRPGRHAPLAHDFLDHLAPALHLFVVLERERPDLPGTMAGHALAVEQAGGVPGVGDLTLRPYFRSSSNQTPADLRRSLRHLLAGQELVNRSGQIAGLDLGLGI